MANARIEALNDHFSTHPSLSPSVASLPSGDSLADMLANNANNKHSRPTAVRLPTHRSGFRADASESEAPYQSDGDASLSSHSNAPDSPWSPPPWRPAETSSAWYRHQPYLEDSPMRSSTGARSVQNSRDPSLPHENGLRLKGLDGDENVTLAANIPLPPGSRSPTKELSPEPQSKGRGIEVARNRQAAPIRGKTELDEYNGEEDEMKTPVASPENCECGSCPPCKAGD